jgi:hypothetical protein
VTDYARIQVKFVVSASGDYGDPYVNPPQWQETLTPDEAEYGGRVEAALTPGTEIDTAKYGTCTMLAVRNLDATNFVTLTWRSAANAGVDNKVKIQPGDIFITQDVTAATKPTLVSDTAVCRCEVLIMGT